MLTLDLACPIPWRSTQASSSHVPIATGSPTPRGSVSIALDRELDSNDVQDSDDRSDREKGGNMQVKEDWLYMRYHEALWLGEEHSPLLGFLQHLRRFQRCLSHQQQPPPSAMQTISTVALLLQDRQTIRKRFQCAVTSSRAATATTKGECAVTPLVESISRNVGAAQEATLKRVVRMALESGPGALVRSEWQKRSGTAGMGEMTKMWLQAIECRE
jgi:hypothetical protein